MTPKKGVAHKFTLQHVEGHQHNLCRFIISRPVRNDTSHTNRIQVCTEVGIFITLNISTGLKKGCGP